MNILVVSTFDIRGGAARAAYRLHRALMSNGIISQMLVQSKSSEDQTVLGPESAFTIGLSSIRPILDKIPVRAYKYRSGALFSPAIFPGGLARKINALDPDIVHLHWICAGMMRIEELAKINAPIVWSQHDMWAFSGGCHYDGECKRYINYCGKCPMLGSHKTNDLSARVHRRKQQTFKKIKNLTIVGLSRWLADCASKSSLFNNRPVVNLPNPIDTASFAPVDKLTARSILNLPADKKLVLYGAMSATSDPRKGHRELIEAIGLIPEDHDMELVVFGSMHSPEPDGAAIKTHYLGLIYDDITLQLLYSAADLMVVPSLQENLSNAIMESLSCGTPVVAFDVGGNKDMIGHKQNGFLATPFSAKSLAEGIAWILSSSEVAALSANARTKVLDSFDSDLVAKQYVKLYESILK